MDGSQSSTTCIVERVVIPEERVWLGRYVSGLTTMGVTAIAMSENIRHGNVNLRG